MDEDDFNPVAAFTIAPPSKPSLGRGAPALPAAPSRPLPTLQQQNNRFQSSSTTRPAIPPSAVPKTPTPSTSVSPNFAAQSAHSNSRPATPGGQNSPMSHSRPINGNFTPTKQPVVSPSRAPVSPGPNSFFLDKKTQFGPGSARPKGQPALNPAPSPSRIRQAEPIFLDDEGDIEGHKPKPPPFSNRPQASLARPLPPISAAAKVGGFTPVSSIRPETQNQLSRIKQDAQSFPSLASDGFPLVNSDPYAPKPEVDYEALQSWHCPTGDVTLREYQRAIVTTGLFNNTLVCLPTGLGKTRIAAVIMYNYYRWFPDGKIIFMAPTKPLANQQIEACHAVGGFQQSDMVTMTGTTQAKKRAEEWRSRRIFFCTPQTAENDLDSGICPADKIVLLVIDEAHKATGNYAYVNVVRQVASVHPYFRVLALSATPGSTPETVQTVVSNLLISKIEVRTDESDDVRVHMHTRDIEKIEVPLGDAVQAVRESFSKILSIPVKFLQDSGAMYRKNVSSLTKGAIFTSRESWRKTLATQPIRDEHKRMMIEQNFALAITLFHGNGLLVDHGLGNFQKWFDQTAAKKSESMLFREMLNSSEWASLTQSLAKANSTADVSHPKLAKLEQIITRHFSEAENQAKAAKARNPNADVSVFDTRAIIFTQYRESVAGIVESLKPFAPLVRAVAFVGQSKGLTQKQQLQVMKDFKNGLTNTLVATSIGEEGLDIGEVDLIVCFDAQASPQRMVQRMGRTGRQRNGRIVLLLSPGERIVQKRAETKNVSMVKSIVDGAKYRMYNPPASAIPDEIVPECVEVEYPRYEAFVSTSTTRQRKVKKEDEDADVPAPANNEEWEEAIATRFHSQFDFLTEEELQYLQDYYGFTLDDIADTGIAPAPPADIVVPTPTARIPHSDWSYSYVDLISSIRDSDFACEDVIQEMRGKLKKEDVVMGPSRAKRRKIESRVVPLMTDDDMLLEDQRKRKEEQDLLAPVPGVSAPKTEEADADDWIETNEQEEPLPYVVEPKSIASPEHNGEVQQFAQVDEDDIQLFADDVPMEVDDHPATSTPENAPITVVDDRTPLHQSQKMEERIPKSPAWPASPISRISEPERNFAPSAPEAKIERPPGRLPSFFDVDAGQPTKVPAAPKLLFPSKFSADEWIIPDVESAIQIEEATPEADAVERPPAPVFAVPSAPASIKKTSPQKRQHATPFKQEVESPHRSLDLSQKETPPRAHRRLRKGHEAIFHAHDEKENNVSFNEEDAILASLNSSRQDSASDSSSAGADERYSSPDQTKIKKKKRPRYEVGDIFDLEAELSGEEEDEEDDDEEDEEASWITDSPDTSLNDVNMQAIYRQSLLSQMSPNSAAKAPQGFDGTPKRHNRNHFKMRFLDASAQQRHEAALRGELDPPMVPKSSVSKNLFPSAPKPGSFIDSSSDFDDIVSTGPSEPAAAPSASAVPSAPSQRFGMNATPLPNQQTRPGPQFQLPRNSAEPPRFASVTGAFTHQQQPKYPAQRPANQPAPWQVRPQASAAPAPAPSAYQNPLSRPPQPPQGAQPKSMWPQTPQGNRNFLPPRLANTPAPVPQTSAPVAASAFDDAAFDSALAELDIDALIMSRGKK